ncbi:MAG: hypothetical protein ACLR6O_04015 [Eubacterium sp.]
MALEAIVEAEKLEATEEEIDAEIASLPSSTNGSRPD